MPRIVFVTKNEYKRDEFTRLFHKFGVELTWRNEDNDDIQNLDIRRIAEHKAVKAYERVGRPLIVDATGLGLVALNGLPGGLNSTFWDQLKGAGMCGLVDKLQNRHAYVEDWLCICDGKRLYPVVVKQLGTIAKSPTRKVPFHIDSIFIPKGCSQSLGALTPAGRDKHSYRVGLVASAGAELKSVFDQAWWDG